MIKPKQLKRGDTVAIVSLSSGLAGETDMLWRTYQGINRLKYVFGLNVKVMPNALKGRTYISQHPEARAEDFNNAVKDPTKKVLSAVLVVMMLLNIAICESRSTTGASKNFFQAILIQPRFI